MKRTFTRTGGLCPRCEGRGTVSNVDLTQLYDDSKSIAGGAFTIPGWKSDSWWTVRTDAESSFLDPSKPIRKFTRKEMQGFLYRELTKVKVEGVNLTYEGLIPTIQKSFLSKDVDALQPYIRYAVWTNRRWRRCSRRWGDPRRVRGDRARPPEPRPAVGHARREAGAVRRAAYVGA